MTSTAGLPPGPRWPALLQSVGLLRFRHRFLPALHRRYGDVFTVRVLPSGLPLVLFARPEHARQIFAGDPEVFHAGKGNAILEPVMGEHSLLLQDSTDHRRARRLLTPAFSGAALRGYEPVVAALAREEVDRWVPGRPFRALDRMSALTLEVILHVVFGVTDETRLALLRPLLRRVVDIGPAVVLGLGHPVLHRLPPWRATAAAQRSLDRLIHAEIAERRASPDLGIRSDVLSRLLRVDGDDRLSDGELRDQLVTLLLAGHETTATALAWTLYELGRDPDRLAEARAAAADPDPDRGSAHLTAVLKESMRLHPVIPMVVRHLTGPATVAGVDLPRGVNVAASILLGHARPESFPDPDLFRPARFLEDEVAPHAWIPFGGGVRRCIGAGFAQLEGVTVLREVLLRHDLALAAGPADRPKVRNITSVPARGARIVVHHAAPEGSEPPTASAESGP